MESLLVIFLATVAIATTLNLILKRFDIPTIVGYIFTGIIIVRLFDIKADKDLGHIAEFGIVFLMFTIGLEFSFKQLWKMKVDVFIIGALQVVLTGIVFTLVDYAFDIGSRVSIVVGLALAMSSTAIVLKVLNDNGDISRTYGKKALGILLFQDIAVIPIFIMINILTIKDASVESMIITTAVSGLLLIVTLFFLGKYVINWLLYFVTQSGSQEIFMGVVLFIVIGASMLANKLGFSFTLGAFLAGMMLAETNHKTHIESDLIPFRDILLGLFFISVGMQLDFSIIFKNIFMVVIVLVDVLIIKTALIYVIVGITQARRVAIKTALSLCQIGEFALAIFTLLGNNDLLDEETVQILSTAAIISMIMTPFILKNVGKIAEKLDIEGEPNSEYAVVKMDELSEHFIVCGYGRLGQEIALRLKNQGLPYLVIEQDINLVKIGRERGENVYFGSCSEQGTLQDAGANKCAAIIVTITSEQKAVLVANAINALENAPNAIFRYTRDGDELFSDFGENVHLIKVERAMAVRMIHEALQFKITNNRE